MTHAAGLDAATPHCEACAARERAHDSWWGRTRLVMMRWLDRVNGTPVADISRQDLGLIRRLAEA